MVFTSNILSRNSQLSYVATTTACVENKGNKGLETKMMILNMTFSVNMKGQWVFVVLIRSKLPSYIDALRLIVLHASQLI